MNDRAVSVLTNYDIEVVRTWKGRGAILCETTEGIKILKEYSGTISRIEAQNSLLSSIAEHDYPLVEQVLRNKEGQLISKDGDDVSYILKNYFSGKECNIKEGIDCELAVRSLAKLHKAMVLPDVAQEMELCISTMQKEFDKKNKELKKVRKYVKEKRKKNDFERYLLNHFDGFIERATEITEIANEHMQENQEEMIRKQGSFCHGDYQHHNLLIDQGNVAIINFEKFTLDNQVKDLYQFMRKLLEKNNWSYEIGENILKWYENEKPLLDAEKNQLFFRFIYPEKFWKIINFYYNTGKSFIPERNLEKLEKLLEQDIVKKRFLEHVFDKKI